MIKFERPIQSAQDVIDALGLAEHAEGGYYAEVYRSGKTCADDPGRACATSIYFLLKVGQVSRLHRLDADELWYFHLGLPVRLTMLLTSGELRESVLGDDISAEQRPQVLIPAGAYFGAEPVAQDGEGYGFSLVGCVVAPGFVYEGFALPTREELTGKFPQHVAIIERLTV